jgi:hypothetical protein
MEWELVQRMDDLDSGIADENVDFAEDRHGCRDTCLQGRLIAHIHLYCQRAMAGGNEFSGCRLRGRKDQIGDDHLRTLIDEAARNFLADTACCAGDDDDLIPQLLHFVHPV